MSYLHFQPQNQDFVPSFRFLKWFLKASLGMLFGLLFDPEALFMIPQYSFVLLLLRFLSLSCKSLW